MNTRRLIVSAVIAILAGTACRGESISAPTELARLLVNALTPATMSELIVEVSGPDISPPLSVNIEVDSTGFAAGSLTVPAGSGRRIVVTAVDTAGIVTHRADTTLTLQPGSLTSLGLVLRPLPAVVGLTITFAAVASPSVLLPSSTPQRSSTHLDH